MKFLLFLLAICLAVATASNIRGQEPSLKDSVNAARAEAATGASEPESASGASETDNKEARDSAQENAAAADESKAHAAATQMRVMVYHVFSFFGCFGPGMRLRFSSCLIESLPAATASRQRTHAQVSAWRWPWLLARPLEH